MDNITAKVSCFARAYHYQNNHIHIFGDNIAGKLLGKDYNRIAKNMTDGIAFFCPEFEGTREEGLRYIVDKQLSPSVLGRSAFCENKLKNEIADGCKQYVVFAAGYDTFSIRNKNKSLTVFELDYPQLINDKMSCVRQAQLESSAIHVPCDLAETTWKNKLLDAGYAEDKRAFGSLLGISYYLEKAEFEQLLDNVSEIMTDGSAICFDYPSTEESIETRKTQMLASGAGEQMKVQYSYEEMNMLLRKYSFKLVEHLREKDMTNRYFEEYNRATPMHPMQAPVGVGYVYAVKG